MHIGLHDSDNNIELTLRDFGDRGEAYAARFLEREGYRLVAANFKVPVGRNSKGVQVTGEIDLIALDDDTLCFIEVKTRHSDAFAPIVTAVDRRKQRQIIRTARVYRRIFGVGEMKFRYDVVTVLDRDETQPQIEIHRDLWRESDFRKKRYAGQIWQDFV
ncbi:MAG: YraN family protein [Pyrinomonadaceae bacterium]